jgi:hypothetical protein
MKIYFFTVSILQLFVVFILLDRAFHETKEKEEIQTVEIVENFSSDSIIGKCYRFKNDDPFDDNKILIKVVNEKQNYIQYEYSYNGTRGKSLLSMKKDSIDSMEEIKCVW